MMLQLVLFCFQIANLDEIIIAKTHVGDWPWVLPCAQVICMQNDNDVFTSDFFQEHCGKAPSLEFFKG